MPTVYKVVKLNDSLFSLGDSTGYLQANQGTAWAEAKAITEVWRSQKEMLANRQSKARRSASSTVSGGLLTSTGDTLVFYLLIFNSSGIFPQLAHDRISAENTF